MLSTSAASVTRQVQPPTPPKTSILVRTSSFAKLCCSSHQCRCKSSSTSLALTSLSNTHHWFTNYTSKGCPQDSRCSRSHWRCGTFQPEHLHAMHDMHVTHRKYVCSLLQPQGLTRKHSVTDLHSCMTVQHQLQCICKLVSASYQADMAAGMLQTLR